MSRASVALVAIALSVGAGRARADDHDFWSDILDPHGEEVRLIITAATTAETTALNYVNYDGDPTGEIRTKMLDDAYGMLRYARRIAPHNADLLLMLGKVADDDGRTHAAVDALEAYLREAPQPAAEAHQRLGRLYLRLHQQDAAIRQLRQALVGAQPGAATYVYLASALTASGRTDDAVQLLADAFDDLKGQYWNVDATAVGLALAVAYDRDEELSSAFQTIDHMKGALQGNYAMQLQQSIATLDFEPAIDQRYWQALLYESADFLPEARAEWLNYAAGGADARWKDRALAHVAGIDKLLAEQLAAKSKTKGLPVEPIQPQPPGTYPMP